MLEVALAINPFGRRLLETQARRWYAARELHCDRDAVLLGCPPMPLAQAILQAARPPSQGSRSPGVAQSFQRLLAAYLRTTSTQLSQ